MTENAPRRPSIFQDRSFWGMTITQFLAVFNDNFYKQIVLFVCVERAASSASKDLQGTATIYFTLPFILFSGFCGYLSDRISKRTIVVLAKLAEVVIMLLGVAAFYWSNVNIMFGVLFLLGLHSTLYAPAKYGLLPELFHEGDLPKVNGLFQMTLFLAIILGLATSGATKEHVGQAVWIAPAICIVVAICGFFSALLIRPVPAARPDLRFNWSDAFINKDTRGVIWRDGRLYWALLATSAFWAAGGLLYPLAINDVAMQQFQLGETRTGLMAAGTGLGIALGCVIGMALSHRRFNANLVRFGSWGMLLGLILLALPGSRQGSLLGPVGTSALLVWLGVCAGMYTVPLQVMLQARAPEEHKGRVIGAMNLANWIGIYSSAACYKTVFTPLLVAWQLPQNLLFGGAALFLLPVVLFYHPRSENLDDATHLAEAQSH